MAEVSTYFDVDWQDDVGDLASSFIHNKKKRRKSNLQKFTSDNNFDDSFAQLQSPPNNLSIMKHKKLAKVQTPPLLKQNLGDKLKKSDNLIFTSAMPKIIESTDTSTNFTMLLSKEAKVPESTVIQQKKPVNDILNDSIFESSSFLESVDKIVEQATQKPTTHISGHKKIEKAVISNPLKTPKSSRPKLKSFDEDWENDSPFNRPSFLAQLDDICPTFATKSRTPEPPAPSKATVTGPSLSLAISQTPQPLYASTPVCQTSNQRRKSRLFAASKQKLDLDLDSVCFDEFFQQSSHATTKSSNPKSVEL